MERKGICKNVGVCSKANKVQIITDDEAEFICPECGEELQPYKEDIPAPSKKNPLPIIIAGGVAVVAIIGGIIAFTGNGSKEPVPIADTATVDSVETLPDTVTVVKTDTITRVDTLMRVDTVKVEKIVEKETTPTVRKTTTTTTTTSKSSGNTSGTLKLSYGTYTGAIKNGYPHGIGRLTYSTSRVINKYDTKNRTASAGDYVSGEFVNGYFINGKHYSPDGEVIEVLMIGVPASLGYDNK